MAKFVEFKKLSKKKRRELSGAKRGQWGSVNPVTKVVQNKKAYDRKKARKWSDDSHTSGSFVLTRSLRFENFYQQVL